MKIEITATDKITHVDGVKCRVWDGVTANGIKCLVFVHRICVHDRQDAKEFEMELSEQLPPGRVIDLRLVI